MSEIKVIEGKEYKTADNFPDCIFIEKTKDIPKTYTGGDLLVPITWLDKRASYQQYDIIELCRPVVDGKGKYARIRIHMKDDFAHMLENALLYNPTIGGRTLEEIYGDDDPDEE